MARHIMAVCVVCLLCADQHHFVDGTMHVGNDHGSGVNVKIFHHADVNQRSTVAASDRHLRSSYDALNEKQYAHHRRKRHAGHMHDEEIVRRRPEITESFLKRIFEEYGNDDGTISATEFQRLLQELGLYKLINHNTTENECIGDTALVQHVQPHDLSHKHHNHPYEHKMHLNCTVSASDPSSTLPPCAHQHSEALPGQELLDNATNNYTLNEQDMINLCPVLLFQMASPLDAKRSGCIDAAVLVDVDYHEVTQFKAGKEDIVYVWIYAFISVFACSILGLVGVAIIPFMDSQYYKHIITFLVALAVGTMTGDAMLHLVPHSLAGQSERNMIFKGLTCMSGIVFFYMTEHGLTMISEWRKRVAKSRETKPTSRAKFVRDPDSSMNNSLAGDKVCKSKYSSYPYCYDEISMDKKNDLHMAIGNRKHNSNSSHNFMDLAMEESVMGNNVERKRNGKGDACDANEAVAQSLLPLWNHNNDQQQHNHLPDSNTISTDLDINSMGDGLAVTGLGGSSVVSCGGGSGDATTVATVNGNGRSEKPLQDTVTIILREHEATHHGHSHRHGHVHSPPNSLSAVAWMIIMGDGLHNFTDGMAIGAAFAENIAGGFSTSLAVFCHELPHELGDFAILIKAGMTVKSAVFYNLLTGLLSFFGMIFGIVFGQSQDAAQWMFAAAAGLFIYIALVDMMPELSTGHKSLEQFLLQICGMASGVLIMLFIAIYEGDLMNVFSSASSSSSSNTAEHHLHVH